MDDILINFGGSVKALGNGRIGGHLVTFGDESTPDLSKYGDFFEAATDYDAEDGQKLTTYFHHGLDETIGVKKLGKVEIKTDDVGIWAEGVLAMRDDYEREIYKMVEAGKLSWSSGATTHLVRREKIAGKSAHRVTYWPLSEASLTPTPADYRNTVVAIKSVDFGKNVYTALLKGEKPTAEAKGVLLPGSEENMLLNALQSLNSMFLRFVMQAVGGQDWQSDLYGWDSYYGDKPDPDDGEEIDADKVRAAFDEYRDTALAAIEALSRKPEMKAAQDLLNLFKEPSERDVVTALKSMQFSNFLRAMGAVVEESTRRVSWHDAQRSIKQGRPISQANLETLKGVRDGMKEHVGMLSDLITKHDPEDDNETPTKKQNRTVAHEFARYLAIGAQGAGATITL